MSGLTSFFGWLSGTAQIASAVNDISRAYAGAKVSQAGEAAQRMANEAQASVADVNAQMAEWQRSDALYRGSVLENASRLKTAGLMGRQRVTMAANGIDLNEGSALRVLTDTAIMGETDALTERDNAAREAWALRAQSIDQQNRARLLRSGYVQPGESTTAAVVGSLLSGAGKVASLWSSRQ